VNPKRSTRIAVMAAVVVSSAALLTACSTPGSGTTSGGASTTANQTPVNLVYSTVASGEVLSKGEQPVIDAFMAANPNIKVTIESTPVGDYATKLSTQFRGGAGPDMGRVNGADMRGWQAAGFLTPLDQVVKDQNIDTAAFIPALLGNATINGSLAVLPLGTDTRVLYYNPKLLAAQGITQPPTTWDEMLADVAKFKGTGVYGFGFMDSGNDYAMSSETVGPFVKGAGGWLVNPDTLKAVGSSDPAVLQALQFVQELVKTGATPPGGSNTEPLLAQLFSQNKLAMMLGGPWVRQDILQANPDFKYGQDYLNTVVPVPKAGMVSGSTSGGWFIGIFKNSKNQDACAKLLAFIQQKENIGKLNTGEAFPPRVDGLTMSPWADDPFYKAYAEQLKGTGRVIPPIAGSHEVAVDFLNAVSPVLLDPTKSAADALKAFDDLVNSTVLK